VEVLKATDAVADLHQKIADRVDGIMLGLDARVASLKEGLKILTDEVSNAKSNDIAMTTLRPPLLGCQAPTRRAPEFPTDLNMKIASENIDNHPAQKRDGGNRRYRQGGLTPGPAQ